jgi:hypothetical protein
MIFPANDSLAHLGEIGISLIDPNEPSGYGTVREVLLGRLDGDAERLPHGRQRPTKVMEFPSMNAAVVAELACKIAPSDEASSGSSGEIEAVYGMSVLEDFTGELLKGDGVASVVLHQLGRPGDNALLEIDEIGAQGANLLPSLAGIEAEEDDVAVLVAFRGPEPVMRA